ncbi:MAG: hypothetical protein JRG69_11820 [Deltaproteobacteria bacterium]|nr:hypothetical protein [Deltaproteobacteria bacterium]
MNRARLGQEAFPAREDYLGFIELLMDASEMFNMRVAALKCSTCGLRLIA